MLAASDPLREEPCGSGARGGGRGGKDDVAQEVAHGRPGLAVDLTHDLGFGPLRRLVLAVALALAGLGLRFVGLATATALAGLGPDLQELEVLVPGPGLGAVRLPVRGHVREALSVPCDVLVHARVAIRVHVTDVQAHPCLGVRLGTRGRVELELVVPIATPPAPLGLAQLAPVRLPGLEVDLDVADHDFTSRGLEPVPEVQIDSEDLGVEVGAGTLELGVNQLDDGAGRQLDHDVPVLRDTERALEQAVSSGLSRILDVLPEQAPGGA